MVKPTHENIEVWAPERSYFPSGGITRLQIASWILLVSGAIGSCLTRAETLEEVLRRPELEQRKSISDTTGRWFLADNFEPIEALLEQSRREELRSSSGLWILGLAEEGIDNLANYRKLKSDEQWDDLESHSRRWIEKYPQSSAAHVARAFILRNRAWLYRGGGGYANTVSKKQFAEFHEQIAKAKTYLLANRKIITRDPNGYLALLSVQRLEKDGDQSEFERTFAEAVQAFPDYFPIYFEAVTYYLPKWKGDAAEVERFARKVMQLCDERTGRMLYARIYWYASQSQFRENVFLVSSAHWSDMRAGFEEILAEFPDQWNINNFARFACLVNDEPTTTRAFAMLKGNPIDEAWASRDQYDHCKELAGRVSL